MSMQFQLRRLLAVLIVIGTGTTVTALLYLHLVCLIPKLIGHCQTAKPDGNNHDQMSEKSSEPCARIARGNYKPPFHNQTEDYQADRSAPIPHIIHQIWDLDRVPYVLEEAVQSWQSKNPTWTYWLWTLDDGYKLLDAFYPSEYLTLFKMYGSDTFRFDALRLFILHTFGGVCADIDMQCLKPLDPWTYGHSCILTEEPYEHSYVVGGRVEANAVNGFMACAPEHPFLKIAIATLHSAARQHYDNSLYATGPLFLDDVLRNFCFGARTLSTNHKVTVVPPSYFLPTYDPSIEGILSEKCSPSHVKRLAPAAQNVCRALWRRDYRNEVLRDSYTVHKWMNLYGEYPNWKMRDSVPLSEVLQVRTNVSSEIAKFLHRTN